MNMIKMTVTLALLLCSHWAAASVVFLANFDNADPGEAWDGKMESGTLVGNWTLGARDSSRINTNSLGVAGGEVLRLSDTAYNYTANLSEALTLTDGSSASFDYRAKAREFAAARMHMITFRNASGDTVLSIGTRRGSTGGFISHNDASGGWTTQTNAVLLEAENPASNNGAPDNLDRIELKFGSSTYDIYLNGALFKSGVSYVAGNGTQITDILFTSAGTESSGGAFYDNISVVADSSDMVVINPAEQAQLITNWGYDIKNLSVISSLTASKAQLIFGVDGLNTLRMPVLNRSPDDVAHPGPGEIDTTFYIYDGEAGSLKMATAVQNAKDARPDLVLFAGPKINFVDLPTTWFTVDTTGDGLADGVDPANYARLLADYLRFWEHDNVRKDTCYAIDFLGLDNENTLWLTAAQHVEVVTTLWNLSQQTGTVDLVDTTHASNQVVTVPAAFTMPRIVGIEGWGPRDGLLDDLMSLPNGDSTIDIVGTHLYVERRDSDWERGPDYDSSLYSLVDLAQGAGSNDLWNTELHWGKDTNADDITNSEGGLATIFDCMDLGFSGFSWWGYIDGAEIFDEIRRAISSTTIGSRPVAINDPDGFQIHDIEGTLITRAFIQSGMLQVWALNNTSTTHTNLEFALQSGKIGGNVSFRQWSIDEGGTAIDASGVTDILADDLFTYTLPSKSITVFSVPFIASGSDAFYRLNGDATDSSGNGNDGTPSSGTTNYVDGYSGQALVFDGTSDSYVSVPWSSSNDFTIAFWMKGNVPATALLAGSTNGFGVALSGSKVSYSIGAETLLSTSSVTDGGWHHVVANRNGITGDLELFIDGVSEATQTGAPGGFAIPSELLLGSSFDGFLDEVRFYTRCLTVAEVAGFSTTVGFEADFTGSPMGEAWLGKLNPGTQVGVWTLNSKGSSRVVTNSAGIPGGEIFRMSGDYDYTANFPVVMPVEDLKVSFDYRTRTIGYWASSANNVELRNRNGGALLKISMRVGGAGFIRYNDATGSMIQTNAPLLGIWDDLGIASAGPDEFDSLRLELDTDGYAIYLNDALFIDAVPYIAGSERSVADIRFSNGVGISGIHAYYDNFKVESSGFSYSSVYAAWAGGYGLNGVDAGSGSDPDEDGYSNLEEFAYGGDPSDPGWAGYPPLAGTLSQEGTNWFTCSYAVRTDADNGLTYTLKTTDDLVYGTWVETGITFLGGAGLAGTDYTTATNAVPADNPQRFIRLFVELTE